MLSPNLEVRFEKTIPFLLAKKFTKFWQENGFVGKKEQIIKLIRFKTGDVSGILICLIPSIILQKDEVLNLNSEEKESLKILQRGLRSVVFKNQNVFLAYTDDHFQKPKLIVP